MMFKNVFLVLIFLLSSLALALEDHKAWAQSAESNTDKGAVQKSVDAPKPSSSKEAAPANTSSPSLPPGASPVPSTTRLAPSPVPMKPSMAPSEMPAPPPAKSLTPPFQPKPIPVPPELGKPVQPLPEGQK